MDNRPKGNFQWAFLRIVLISILFVVSILWIKPNQEKVVAMRQVYVASPFPHMARSWFKSYWHPDRENTHKKTTLAYFSFWGDKPTLTFTNNLRKDKVIFQFGFYRTNFSESIAEKKENSAAKVSLFINNLAEDDFPTDTKKYTQVWHYSPLSQGNTGACWTFAGTSFYESEVKRITGRKIKLSEMYYVYWQYVEQAHYFVQTQGKMTVTEGSESPIMHSLLKEHGAVPLSIYTGLLPGHKVHDQVKMFAEISAYWESVKKQKTWDEDEVVRTTRSILDRYIGRVPESFTFEGKEYTPTHFVKDVLNIHPDDYLNFLSLKTEVYWKKVEFKVPDNWNHNKDFINIPLDAFMSIIKTAIKNGYSISLYGDLSEAGYDISKRVAVVPSFDIPSEDIDEDARTFRFLNGFTTDDHCIHLVGYTEYHGKTWFLIKNSGGGIQDLSGYDFFDEDYVKLKMLGFIVHKDAVKKIIKGKAKLFV